MSNKFYQAEAYAPASAGARDISEYGTQGADLSAAQDTTASHHVQFVSFTDADAAAVGYFNKVDNTTPLSAATDAHPVRVLVDSTSGLNGSMITCNFTNTPGDVSTFAAASANVTTPLSSGSGQIKFDSVHDGKTAAIIMQDRSSFEFTIATGSVTLTAVGIKDLGARERRLRTLGHY